VAITPLVLYGRLVTFDPERPVIDDGALYIGSDERIAAVQRRTAAAPSGFERAARLETRGCVYPGLIDLHNHLVYNATSPSSRPGNLGGLVTPHRERVRQLLLRHLRSPRNPLLLGTLVKLVTAKPVELTVPVRLAVRVWLRSGVLARAHVVKLEAFLERFHELRRHFHLALVRLAASGRDVDGTTLPRPPAAALTSSFSSTT
jgi:hypothetical protein